MKKYLLTVFLLGLIFTQSCTSSEAEQHVSKRSDQISDTSVYAKLRNKALNGSHVMVEQSLADSMVFGLLLDWELGNGVSTLVAYRSGEAGIYFSSGGAVISELANTEVSTAARNLVNTAQDFRLWMEYTKATPLPHNDCVRFYALTKQGIYAFQESYGSLEEGRSKFSTLFKEANKLIAAMRRLK